MAGRVLWLVFALQGSPRAYCDVLCIVHRRLFVRYERLSLGAHRIAEVIIIVHRVKGEVKPEIKFSPVVFFGVLSRIGFGPRKLRRSLPLLFPIELAHFHQNWVTAPY